MFQALASGNLPGEDLENVGKNGQTSGCHVDMFSYEKNMSCIHYAAYTSYRYYIYCSIHIMICDDIDMMIYDMYYQFIRYLC